MKDSREKRAAEIQDSIRKILYSDWNPIGFAGLLPKDEYDSYIAPVYRILAGSRSERELVEFLSRTESDIVGASGRSADDFRPVALRLLQLNVRL